MDKWDRRFMELAETVAGWSSCYQENRHIGAVIVKDKRIMTTGYNGAPAGVSTCTERKSCLRREKNIPSGTCQEICYAVHAEQNAIIQAAKLGVSVDGAHAVLHASALRDLRAHDHQRRDPPRRLSARLSDDFSLQLFSEAGLIIEKYEEL